MANRVLILQSEEKSAHVLAEIFSKRGDKVWRTTSVSQAESLIKANSLDLVVVDLHTPDNVWLNLLTTVRQEYPGMRLIVTNKYPDVRREFLAKEQGVRVFLREPFSAEWVERALNKLAQQTASPKGKGRAEGILPRVKVSMRLKITFPYAMLAILFALAAAYMVSRYVMESIQDRFTMQLVDAGKLSADWMVQEENRMLTSLRDLANTQGMAEAVKSENTEALRDLTLARAINQQEDAIDILNMQGISLLSLRHNSGGAVEDYSATRGNQVFTQLPFIQNVLQGKLDQGRDKYAGLVRVGSDDLFYIAGPILGSDNQLAGVVLVGKTLTTLVRQNRQDTLAQITLYSKDGTVLASSVLDPTQIHQLDPVSVIDVLSNQDTSTQVRSVLPSPAKPLQSAIRDLVVSSSQYAELLAPWEARGGEDLGVMGVALAENNLVRPTILTKIQAFLIVAVALIGVIIVGILLANQVTKPLSKIVKASTRIAHGDLEVKVSSGGNDEVAVVASAFNYMVSGLQEGVIYRDLLGRTVSPEVREAMRKSFASGELRLEGQSTVATVLMSDIRGFTSLSEKAEPTTILAWLNEYFGELVPIITNHGGVVDKFEGDAMLAFFGILPRLLPPEESAFAACQAGVEMLAAIDKINQKRALRGEPPLITGIGINTGNLIAGGLGTSDRLNYTIIGDTVNTTQRLQTLTGRLGESGVVINETTLTALKGRRGDFRFEPMGEQSFPGKLEQLWLYRLMPKVESLPIPNPNLVKSIVV
jgi:class 3 adenylate cyclase/ActR/RegA family two-component response regulator